MKLFVHKNTGNKTSYMKNKELCILRIFMCRVFLECGQHSTYGNITRKWQSVEVAKINPEGIYACVGLGITASLFILKVN